MEEVINCNEKLIYCLNKINVLISKVDKFNTAVKFAIKTADVLEIAKADVDLIDLEQLNCIKEHFCALIENSYSDENEIEKAKLELEEKTNIVENEIERNIKIIEDIQNEEIYRKAIRLIYVCRWREKEREISYLDYKDTFISKLIGEAKYKRLSVEKKKLESELIKKEYYEIVDCYNGENVREIVVKLCAVQERDFELLEFKDKLIKQFMIDETSIKAAMKVEWSIPNLLPYGFFEKIKYYKNLNKVLEKDIIELKNQLDKNLEECNTKTNIKQIIVDLNKINNEIKTLITGIKLT